MVLDLNQVVLDPDQDLNHLVLDLCQVVLDLGQVVLDLGQVGRLQDASRWARLFLCMTDTILKFRVRHHRHCSRIEVSW